MRTRRPGVISSTFNNPVLVGAVTILVILVAVYLSYIAENGLPFIPVYNVNVQVADGGELNKNADVRIGGARVGQVLKVTPEPASAHWPHPYAQVELAIDKDLGPLPNTTQYQVRLSSVLGGQYIELFPGAKTVRGVAVPTVPDGGTFALNTNPKLDPNRPYVDISQAFDVFGPKTQAGIRSVANGLGDAFAGRGTQINDGIDSLGKLIGPLQNVLALFAAPSTQLAGFLNGLAETTSAIAPDANTLFDSLAKGATTFHALDVPALGTTLDDLPSTETVGTRVLRSSEPVLAELASITQSLKPAAAELPAAAKGLDAVLNASPASLKLFTPVAREVNTTLAATNTLATTPSAQQFFQVLGVNDLGTAGASAFVGLGGLLSTISAEQESCNIAALWLRNFADVLSEGNAQGNWLRLAPVISLSDLVSPSSGQPSSDLHINTSPIETGGQCQAGNEVYESSATPVIGAGSQPTSGTVDQTAPPPGVLAEGMAAGLVK